MQSNHIGYGILHKVDFSEKAVYIGNALGWDVIEIGTMAKSVNNLYEKKNAS